MKKLFLSALIFTSEISDKKIKNVMEKEVELNRNNTLNKAKTIEYTVRNYRTLQHL